MSQKWTPYGANTPAYITQRRLTWLHWSRPIRIALAKSLLRTCDGLQRLAIKIAPEIIRLEG